MKIAVAQMNSMVDAIEDNCSKMLQYIERASKQKVDLLLFPELSLCAYPLTDEMFRKNFFERLNTAIDAIKQCAPNMCVVFGAPFASNQRIYNAAYVCHAGKIMHVARKKLLPNYNIFNEKRYFSSNKEAPLSFEFQGKKIGLLICEDIWQDFVNEANFKYEYDPVDDFIGHDLDILCNISASPFSTSKENKRMQVLKNVVKKLKCHLVYANAVGCQDEIIFDGNSTFLDDNGVSLKQAKHCSEDFVHVDLFTNNEINKSGALENEASDSNINDLLSALKLGLSDFLNKINQSKVIVGVSGGIDSALVLAIVGSFLPQDNIKAVYMPTKFSSDLSEKLSRQLCKNLGIALETFDIESSRVLLEHDLKKTFSKQDSNQAVTYENIQARIRALVLMAYSNEWGGVIVNTSNKSELAVGYSTLYGDLIGAISPLGDLYKHQVYALSEAINVKKEIIPYGIIDREPSAELRYDQKDSDSLPDYKTLDAILKYYLEDYLDAQTIINMGYNESVVKDVVFKVDVNEFKRKQAPPILRVSNVSFGIGRRMNISSFKGVS